MDTAKGRPINIPYTLKKSSYNNSAWSRKNTAKGVTTAAEIRYNFFLLATLSNRTLPKIPNDIPRTAPTITSLGSYEIKIQLHKDVDAIIKLFVIEE